ncbi:MAG: hypothetical protein CMJ64_08730 [Planctomycetaceae bacterium]|nr:hypothetical protein [Planctomycetaceae bacterium]
MGTCKSVVSLSVVLAALMRFAVSANAEPLAEDQAVEAGAEALQGPISFPWYDAESDGIRRIDVKPPADLKNRQSEWLLKAKQKKKKKANNAALSEAFWMFMRILGWTAVAIAFVAVGYLLVRAFLMAETENAGPAAARKEEADPRGDVDRVESLPFQLQQPLHDLLSEARRHYEAGNFAEAIVYLYSYQLVELDKHQLIRLTKGKTNRQYLREVRRRGDLSGLLRRSMLMFEDVFFGNHAIERSRFESVWQELDTFHHGLEQAIA